MESKLIARILRVERQHIPKMTQHGRTLHGPYWYGVYQENGKTIKIYIGKELPKELKRLINKRYKKPGCRNYTWPRPKGAKER